MAQQQVFILLLLFVSPLLGQIYWGLWDTEFNKENLSVSKIENDVGRRPSIIMTYLNIGDNLSLLRLNAIHSQGAIPIVTVQPNREGELAAVAQGGRNTWIKRFAEDINKFGFPIFIRFAHEMNGKWYNWSQELYPAGTYNRAWNYFFQRLKFHKATKVTSVWCPNAENDLKKGPDDKQATITSTLESVWPGPDNVDWLCLDGYSKKTSQKSFLQVFTSSITHLRKLSNKPIMIGETGVTERADPSFKSEWIKQAFIDIPNMDIQAFLWFNENKKDSAVEYDTSPDALAEFRQGINNGYFTAGQFGDLNVNPIPVFEKLPGKSQALVGDLLDPVTQNVGGVTQPVKEVTQPVKEVLGLPSGPNIGVIITSVVGSLLCVIIVVACIVSKQRRPKYETV